MPRSCSDNFYLQLVYEYLLHMGLDRTASSFKEECGCNNYPVPDEIGGVQRSAIHTLLQLYDEGDKEGFLQKFNACDIHQARTSIEGKKLTADLLVYFAALSLLKDNNDEESLWVKPLVHAPPRSFKNCESLTKSSVPIRSTHSHTSTNSETLERSDRCECCGQIICNRTVSRQEPAIHLKSHCIEDTGQRALVYPCMRALLDYLENECSNLRNDPYFVPYFALPFTTSPQLHDDYKHIFQGSWPKSLRRRLWDFLVHHRQAASLPSLVRLLSSSEMPVKNVVR